MKITFYTAPYWAFGSIHSELCDRLQKYGIQADITDATVGYHIESFCEKLQDYDIVVADPGASVALTDSYGVDRSKIVLISHGEPDLHSLINRHGREAFSQFRDFAVVSESLYMSCLSIGIRPPSQVLRLGINTDKFCCDISPTLRRVGFAASMSRENAFGVEIKRGYLVRLCSERAGLDFVPANTLAGHQMQRAYQDMPAYYQQVDAVVMSSLQEGAGLPPLEAAASGRLVIGTPCGHFPRLAYHGAGILAPLTDDAFVEFTTTALKFFKENPVSYREKCRSIKQAAQSFDWRGCEMTWAKFFHSVV